MLMAGLLLAAELAALSQQKQLSQYTRTGARRVLRIDRMTFPPGLMGVHSRHGARRP